MYCGLRRTDDIILRSGFRWHRRLLDETKGYELVGGFDRSRLSKKVGLYTSRYYTPATLLKPAPWRLNRFGQKLFERSVASLPEATVTTPLSGTHNVLDVQHYLSNPFLMPSLFVQLNQQRTEAPKPSIGMLSLLARHRK